MLRLAKGAQSRWDWSTTLRDSYHLGRGTKEKKQKNEMRRRQTISKYLPSAQKNQKTAEEGL